MSHTVTATELLHAFSQAEPTDQVMLSAMLWDVIDALLIRYIGDNDLWTSLPSLLDSAPTPSKIEVVAPNVSLSSADLNTFAELSKTARFGMLQQASCVQYFQIGHVLASDLDGLEQPVVLRIPVQGIPAYQSESNSTFVETAQGDKSIFLRHAMVTQQDVDVVILTNLAGSEPGGFIIHQLKDCFGFQVQYGQSFLQFGADRFTTVEAGNYPQTPFRHLLTVHLPRIETDTSLEERIKGMCKGIRATLLAMEALGYPTAKVALPVLQAHLLDPTEYQLLIKNLLNMGIEWLQNSEASKELTYCVYFGNEVEQWVQEFDTALGRISVQGKEDELLKYLQQETLTIGLKVAKKYAFEEVDVINDLLKQETIRATLLASSARKLCERFCAELFQHSNRKRPYDLLSQIEALGQMRIAPWMRSYLHTIRVLGNEGVHVRDEEKQWRPNGLSPEDMHTMLIAIRSIFNFWLQHHEDQR